MKETGKRYSGVSADPQTEVLGFPFSDVNFLKSFHDVFYLKNYTINNYRQEEELPWRNWNTGATLGVRICRENPWYNAVQRNGYSSAVSSRIISGIKNYYSHEGVWGNCHRERVCKKKVTNLRHRW
ncbi:MAG: hypothetical protein WC865_16845 [Bacteroidales bacterium]